MAEAKTRSISFPRYAEYNCAFKYIVEQALGCKYVMPPPLTKRTMDLGTKHSPDFVCTPFKTMLGSMIESLEAGADTLLMTHGLCRLGYYGELLEQILRDLGYQFDFINLSEYDMSKKKEYIRIVRRINPKVNPARFLAQFMEGLRMVEYLDEITGEYYKNCGFDAMDGPTGSSWPPCIPPRAAPTWKAATGRRGVPSPPPGWTSPSGPSGWELWGSSTP